MENVQDQLQFSNGKYDGGTDEARFRGSSLKSSPVQGIEEAEIYQPDTQADEQGKKKSLDL